MASTYSALKIELIATGEQSGTWGTTTNNNLGDAALGEAITGSADVAFSSADVTVTLTDSNGSQAARNLRLNLTGTSGGARQLILGAGCQIEKLYLINNGLADAVTVKNTSGSGIAVPAGKSMFVFNNGTNVVDATTHLSSLTLGSALPVTSGGTGSTSTTFVNLASNVTGTLPIANGGTGSTSTTFVNAATNITGTLPIANGGTGSTSTTFVNAATNITGTLPIANGGTGATTLREATISTLGYTTTATAAGTTTLTATSTATQFFTGSTTQTVVLPVASTMTLGQEFVIHNNSSGSVTVNSSGANLVGTLTANTTATITCILTSGTSAASWDFDLTGFTTALPVARGGTGLTALGTANQVLAVNAGATALEFQTAGGGSIQSQLFSAPGTWTRPSSVTQVRVTVVGGGGGSYQAPTGNGGLACGIVAVSAPVAVTVGSGGTPGGGGRTGGSSSFGTVASATGGAGNSPANTPGAPGSGTITGTALKTSSTFGGPVFAIQGVTTKPTGTPGVTAYSEGSFYIAGAGAQGAPPIQGGSGGGAVLVEWVGS
jgi:hypothetical protein